MTTTPSRDGQNPSDILRLDSFEAAFATGPELQNTQRRFKTLVVERPSTQQLGGTSYVCRATTTDGLVLAVKRMLPATQADPQEQRDSKAVRQASLFQEYKALLTVSGKPGFPLVYGYGYSEGGPMILMEWVRGQTLHEAEEAMPHDGAGVRADVVCALGAAVLRVLLNAGGPDGALVHRDISSRNIMLRTDARSIQQQVEQLSFDVVLIDFGSSTLPVRTDSALTVSGLMRFGTPAYAPPEMLTSDVPVPEEVRRSPLVDVYALCSVLYELYSGRAPFQTHGSYYLEKTTKAPAPLVPHREADRQLCAYILGGIRQNPQSRPDTRAPWPAGVVASLPGPSGGRRHVLLARTRTPGAFSRRQGGPRRARAASKPDAPGASGRRGRGMRGGRVLRMAGLRQGRADEPSGLDRHGWPAGHQRLGHHG